MTKNKIRYAVVDGNNTDNIFGVYNSKKTAEAFIKKYRQHNIKIKKMRSVS